MDSNFQVGLGHIELIYSHMEMCRMRTHSNSRVIIYPHHYLLILKVSCNREVKYAFFFLLFLLYLLLKRLILLFFSNIYTELINYLRYLTRNKEDFATSIGQ